MKEAEFVRLARGMVVKKLGPKLTKSLGIRLKGSFTNYFRRVTAVRRAARKK